MKNKMIQQDLTTGNITAGLWRFALPLMLGNVMQQLYNLADTWVVGRYLGDRALAAVGSSYTLMTFLNSVILGLCLGSGTFFSIAYGEKDERRLKNGIFLSFVMIFFCSLLLEGAAFSQLDRITVLLQIPTELQAMTKTYLYYIFWGIAATFLYNYYSNLLRGIGNSVVPLVFLGISVVLNIGLDIYFVAVLNMGIKGAAAATVISQYLAGTGLMIYTCRAYPALRPGKEESVWCGRTVKQLISLSGFTCIQQSVMNFGILMVQGIVNSFGAAVMSAFAVAVKIDTIAYMPVQDFGNAFSTFVAQNYGAGKKERIQRGIFQSLVSVLIFCLCISTVVVGFAKPLMELFIEPEKTEIVRIGVNYLRIEGAFYIGIGILFMLYGYYRAVNMPKMSVVLTVLSLGSRVLLAYFLSKIDWIGVTGIWAAIPIGWLIADTYGIIYYLHIPRE